MIRTEATFALYDELERLRQVPRFEVDAAGKLQRYEAGERPKVVAGQPVQEVSKPKRMQVVQGTISLIVASNPKKLGTGAHQRFALYRTGMTCGEFLAAGGKVEDLRWDSKQGYIKIIQEENHEV